MFDQLSIMFFMNRYYVSFLPFLRKTFILVAVPEEWF